MVLIETLWNVKDLRRSIFLQGTGFNRNIVECKDEPNWKVMFCDEVLIETLWNVKAGFPLRSEGRW